MKDVQRQTRSYLMALFRDHGYNPRSDLGQNFLIDVNLIELVVRSADLGPDDVVLEVGAGTGGMTAFLAAQAARVVSIEIDPRMYQLAASAVEHCTNVVLLNRDILKNKNRLCPEIMQVIEEAVKSVPGGRLKLVANLPYSVATPVISNVIASELPWTRIVATIQWELAEKMAASPGSPVFGALSAWIQAQSSIRIIRRMGPNVFWPRPKVDSAIISIWRDEDLAARIADRSFLHDFLRRLFHHRRKLVRSVVAGMYRMQLDKSAVDAILAEQQLRPDLRAEQIDIETLIRLANRVRQAVLAAGDGSGGASGVADDDPGVDGADVSADPVDSPAPAPEI